MTTEARPLLATAVLYLQLRFRLPSMKQLVISGWNNLSCISAAVWGKQHGRCSRPRNVGTLPGTDTRPWLRTTNPIPSIYSVHVFVRWPPFSYQSMLQTVLPACSWDWNRQREKGWHFFIVTCFHTSDSTSAAFKGERCFIMDYSKNANSGVFWPKAWILV